MAMRDDGMVVPSGPDELFTQYYGYVRKIVASTPMIPSQDVDDVAMEIMTRLIERDVVGMFDPGMTFSHGDQKIPARFRTFLTAQVNLYIQGQRDKLGRRRKRELLIIDTPPEEGNGLSWADMFGSEDDLSGLDAAEWVSQARSFLALIPKRSDRDRCDLVRLFDELIAQVTATGTVNTRETAAHLGVSSVVTSRWMQWLRQNLRQQAPLSRRVTIAGEVYTVAHINQAVALLRARKGSPHVKGPLQAAGNPLWRIDYHSVSQHEQAIYPECKVPTRHKGKGYFAPHVLNAIVHHLERAVAT